MQNYQDHVSTRETPQTEPIPGSDQIENSAGGYAFGIGPWGRLERFLVLGTEGGSYYATERQLTRENAQAVFDCLDEDGVRTVETIATISEQGRAPKNDPALFALAIASADGPTDESEAAHAALGALPRVARIPTHLFQFLHYRQAFGGWGSSLRWAVQNWYDRYDDPSYLGYHVAKYRQRYGWSHRDVLRLAHPDPDEFGDAETRALIRWAVRGMEELDAEDWDRLPMVVQEFERFRREDLSPEDVADAVRRYDLPREIVPSEYLGEDEVWEALAEDMPMHALVRNLGNLSKRGILEPMSEKETEIVGQLTDVERIHAARLHPLNVLIASVIYGSGGGRLGSNTWPVSDAVMEALDAAFVMAFDNVEPTGARTLLALDVSGSMSSGAVAGIEGLTPRMAASAMALMTATVEQTTHTIAFSDSGDAFQSATKRRGYGSRGSVVPFPLRSGEGLEDVVERSRSMPFSGTDCALPMLYALENEIGVDAFVVYTDSETWHGDIHPSQALQKYREATGIPAKLVVVGMVANEFTIADPDDAGMLDVVGFDTSAPQVIADFVRQGDG